MDRKELIKLYFEKYGKTVKEALKEYDSVFDFIYDLEQEFGGDKVVKS